jgi:hypothetical protein
MPVAWGGVEMTGSGDQVRPSEARANKHRDHNLHYLR